MLNEIIDKSTNGINNEIPRFEEFKIVAMDSLHRSFGNLNIDWKKAVDEFINNSIQNAWDNDLPLNIKLSYVFNDSESKDERRLKSFSITDQGTGIDKKNIATCLTPSGRLKDVKTLNEHGMGLNTSIEYLTKNNGIYKITSHHKNGSFIVKDALTFENSMRYYPIDAVETTGLKIEFDNVCEEMQKEIFPQNGTFSFWYHWTDLCAKYRKKYDKFVQSGKSFNIDIECISGENVRSRSYIPCPFVLKNPISGKNEFITSFTLSEEDYEIEYKIGAAAVERDEYRIVDGDSSIFWQIHPYRISGNIFGFDTIYNDIVVERMSNKTVQVASSLVGANHSRFSGLRGEKIIKKGGKSYITKDGMFSDSIMQKLDKKAADIFKGIEPHPVVKEKINYIDRYIHRKNTPPNGCPKETIVKHRHREQHENFGYKVRQEETNEFGRIDMIIVDPDTNKDLKILEHKSKKTNADDVLQTFKYMITKPDISIGELWAPEHTDQTKKMVEKINMYLIQTNQKIVLKILKGTLINPHCTPSELAL